MAKIEDSICFSHNSHQKIKLLFNSYIIKTNTSKQNKKYLYKNSSDKKERLDNNNNDMTFVIIIIIFTYTTQNTYIYIYLYISY